MERNVVVHSGRGGVWLGEQAGGVIDGNHVEDMPQAWRVGPQVRCKVDTRVEPLDRLMQMVAETKSAMRGGRQGGQAENGRVVMVVHPNEESIVLG
eukprot:CAMPEP_0196751906 /NCGR_PEP_ID=MMETSP1091-20130531/85394_1 /TAXON_ID=302021 /ORGANISM="Rhodomonas sp., Strain CCMP768" /LENGTH=95 /DNA_ID=CAMNT_0042099767 /DNA_START=10 /DNA_END=293 /DNA_ORIENTATION=-